MLLLLSPVLQAMTDDALKTRLNQLAFNISQDGLSPAANGQRFTLTMDATFPCVVKVTEHRPDSGNDWTKSYRFSLEDMQTGSHFMARDQRRAIVYNASVRYATGERREFSEKQINHFSLSINESQRLPEIQRLIDEAITECRERNEFQ